MSEDGSIRPDGDRLKETHVPTRKPQLLGAPVRQRIQEAGPPGTTPLQTPSGEAQGGGETRRSAVAALYGQPEASRSRVSLKPLGAKKKRRQDKLLQASPFAQSTSLPTLPSVSPSKGGGGFHKNGGEVPNLFANPAQAWQSPGSNEMDASSDRVKFEVAQSYQMARDAHQHLKPAGRWKRAILRGHS